MAFLERDEGFLRYEVTDLTPPWVAAPETILFCHGVATDCDIWSAWLPLLADRYRLVRFDTRGFGRSSVPPRDFAWSLDALADDILAIAGATGAERFHLAAESLGGTVALFLAARGAPEVLSVTAVSTAHIGGSIAHVQAWRAFIDAHGMEAWSREMMQHRFLTDRVEPEIQAWFHAVQAHTAKEPLLDAADLLVRTDLTADLPRIALPVLLLSGDASPFVPVTTTAAIHRLVPHSEMQVFPGARHALACSHGPECATALRDFLGRHRSA